MKRIIRLHDKTTGEIFSYPTVTELIKRNGEDRLGISLAALYNSLSINNGQWESKKYKVYYETIDNIDAVWE